uniref:Uncharacterized protein n=1 Tax=Rhizophora mucronata TaxID=61149 RepID=A0A2P2QYK0_RHIMU
MINGFCPNQPKEKQKKELQNRGIRLKQKGD